MPIQQNLEMWGRRKWHRVGGAVPPAYIANRCSEEFVLTLHAFAKTLPRLPAMFLKQPVPNVILAERTEEKKTKDIPIIRRAFPCWVFIKNKQTKTKRHSDHTIIISTTTTITIIVIHITYSVYYQCLPAQGVVRTVRVGGVDGWRLRGRVACPLWTLHEAMCSW